MRALVDTSILVRALIKPQGTVGPVLARLRNQQYTLLYSDNLLHELADVLGRRHIRDKYDLTEEDARTVVALLLLRGEPVVPDRRFTICRDPKDNELLEIAATGKASVIVTGDEDLLVLNPFEGIPIVGSAEFLEMLDKGTTST